MTELQNYYSNESSLTHLSSFITSTKCTSLFSRKYLERSGRMAEWSMPLALPPSAARLPTQLLFFSWSLSHRDDWLTRSRSSHRGLNRPFRVLGLRPAGNCTKKKQNSLKRVFQILIQTTLNQFKIIHLLRNWLCCRVFIL